MHLEMRCGIEVNKGWKWVKEWRERKKGERGNVTVSETDKTERGNFSTLSLFPIVPDRGEKEDRVQENKNQTDRDTGSRWEKEAQLISQQADMSKHLSSTLNSDNLLPQWRVFHLLVYLKSPDIYRLTFLSKSSLSCQWCSQPIILSWRQISPAATSTSHTLCICHRKVNPVCHSKAARLQSSLLSGLEWDVVGAVSACVCMSLLNGILIPWTPAVCILVLSPSRKHTHACTAYFCL